MKDKVRLLASSSLAVALFAGAAHAQQAAPAAAAAPVRSTTIEELVVTAEKRQQSLQEVPVAISAYTSEKRDLVGINTVQDMTNFTPGLQYSSQADRIALRGVGRLTNVQAADPGVATYSDGVYTSSTVEAGKTPLFIDRVEVLRGPQGTLYGRNSIGGAINVISKRPTEDFYGEVRATVANYEHTLLEAAVSGPLSDDVQFRLGGNWDKQNKGYFKNIVPGMPSEGNVVDTYYVEGQLQMKVGDHLDGWIKAAVSGWNNGSGGPGARTSYTPGPYNTLFTLPSATYINPGYACSGGASNVVNLSPSGCVNPQSLDPRKIADDTRQTVSLDDSYIFATEWTYHFDNMDLKYTGGWDNYHYTLISDLDGGAVSSFQLPIAPFASVATTPCAAVNFGAPGACQGLTIRPSIFSTYEENKHWYSHELNLSSSGDGDFQWLAGAYFYHEGYKQPVSTTLQNQTELAGTNIAGAVPGVPIAQDLLQRPYDDQPELQDTSYAGFGQIDWKFASDFKVTLGLRYSHDHKEGTEAVRVVCFAVPACLGGLTPQGLGTFTPPTDVTAAVVYTAGIPQGVTGPVTFTPDGFAHRDYDASFHAWTGTAGVQWEPDRDTNVYARYSRGYKAGGFNVGISTVLGQFPYTGPEHADAFEVGLKKNFGRTLQTNVAAFYYNYTDLQAPLTIANTAGGLAQTQSVFLNVPKAVSMGVEFEGIWTPIDNLVITATYAYNDAHIKELSGVVDPVDPTASAPGAVRSGAAGPADIYSGQPTYGQNLKGNALPNAAKNKVAINAVYTWDMPTGSLSPSVSYIWRDKQYGTIFERAYYAAPSWDQVDLRLTYKDRDNKYSVIGFVKNVFNDLGYESGNTATRYSGLTAAGTPTVLPLGINGVQPTYYLTPPRTYGVELQYRF